MKKLFLLVLLFASQFAFAGYYADTTLSSAGNSAAVTITNRINPTNITLVLNVTGSVNVTVQYAVDANNAVWFNHSDLTNATASSVGTIISPIHAVRLVYNSGTGSATLSILQSGN